MKKTIKELHDLLTLRKKTLATAESCTGGLFAKLLTDIPGSSAYFYLGLVTYSNRAKELILGIPRAMLLKKGAVSKEVAEAMSVKIRNKAKTDLGLGITGIAGPTGGSQTKKVGTVYICACSKNKKICRKFLFKGSRLAVRNKAATQAASMLKRLLQ